MSNAYRARFALAFSGIALISVLAACESEEAGAFQCINDGDCPPGCTCSSGISVVGVCDRDGSAQECGGSCDRETTCPEGTECLFERSEGDVAFFACRAPMGGSGGNGGNGGMGGDGGAGGDCVPAFTDLGGTAEAPVVWEEKFTCVDAQNQCFNGGSSDNNEPITFELVQDGNDLTGRVRFGQGEGDVFEGKLCGNEFRWVDVTPGVEDPERGCWTFTADAFNKRSYVTSEFDCVGAGTRGEGSTPPDVISCQALGANPVDATACPPAPPAAP